MSERCGSVCGGDVCERARGHKGKHRSFHGPDGRLQLVTWTDKGAQRMNKELIESKKQDGSTGQPEN